MLIKDWDFHKFEKDILSYKAILIYGSDRGKVNEKSEKIFKHLKIKSENSLEKIEVDPEELNKDSSYLLDLLYQKSFFSNLTLIKINIDLINDLHRQYSAYTIQIFYLS